MTPNSRARNQRVTKPRQRRQQHLLEVTVRRDKAKEQRNRAIFGFVCKAVLAISLLVGAYIGCKEGLRYFLWENPEYFLVDESIDFRTDGALTREQVLTAAQISAGKNVFSIDLGKAREALDHLPQIERVELRRTLPNRIDINVTERRPIAWVTKRSDEDPSASDKSLLVDARGVVMRTKRVLPEYLLLPIISGVEVENVAPGQKVRTYEMQSALELIRSNSDGTRFQVRNVDISKGYCLVVTDQKRAQITFGLDRIDQQLERLYRVLDHIEPQQREVRTVNLLVERNVPVTFVDPAPEAEPAEESVAPINETPRGKQESVKVEKALPTAVKKVAPANVAPASVKRSTPLPQRRSPADSVKKPFRFNG
jgi:cell division protein FtsQ